MQVIRMMLSTTPPRIGNNNGSDTHSVNNDYKVSVESLENAMATNAYVDFDHGSDDDSIESSTKDYGIQEQECEDGFN